MTDDACCAVSSSLKRSHHVMEEGDEDAPPPPYDDCDEDGDSDGGRDKDRDDDDESIRSSTHRPETSSSSSSSLSLGLTAADSSLPPPHRVPLTAWTTSEPAAAPVASLSSRRQHDSDPNDDDDDEREWTEAERNARALVWIADLGDDQRTVLDAVRSGTSVFFTGCAGTGKSFLLKKLIEWMPGRGTYVTASTGIAAVNIGGTTIHSFAGIGTGDQPVDGLMKRVNFNEPARTRWRECERLIIDEVSMLSADLFDKLEAIARAVRKSKRPFGGIQLVLTGDFLQLPPVVKDHDDADSRRRRGVGGGIGALFSQQASGGGPIVTRPLFCFQAASWRAAVPATLELTRVFRQSDTTMVTMLGELREGRVTPATLHLLEQCIDRPLDCSDGIEPTHLYSLRAQVLRENEEKLERLKTQARVFRAKDVASAKRYRDALVQNVQVGETLTLKIGAQVMLLKNLDVPSGLCNGSRGVVVGFTQETPLPMACADAKEVKRQKKMAATTVFFKKDQRPWFPQVKFDNGTNLTLVPVPFEISVQGKIVASRTQIPLMLAWAITVHKSQGCTLSRCELSLESAFEYGQVYVALSRARTLEGLRLRSFEPSRVRAHPAAVAFYRAMREAREARARAVQREADEAAADEM